MNFSLLKQFNWQSIEKQNITNTLNQNEVISYSDTSFYFFGEQTFISRSQATDVSFVIGSDGTKSIINQKTGTWEGNYKLNQQDSTITFSGPRHLTVYDRMSFPGTGRDSIFIESKTAKILLLNKQFLKIKVSAKDPIYIKSGNEYIKVEDNPSYLYPEGRIFTYQSIKK